MLQAQKFQHHGGDYAPLGDGDCQAESDDEQQPEDGVDGVDCCLDGVVDFFEPVHPLNMAGERSEFQSEDQMHLMLDGVTGNGAGDTKARDTSLVKSGVFKYKKINTGTCTLDLKDADTDAVIKSLSVAADNPASGYEEVALPERFYTEVSSASGSFALTAWVDG